MRKILIPIDFTPSTRKAAVYAMRLFSKEPVQFILLSSYNHIEHNPTELKILALRGKMKIDTIDLLKAEVRALEHEQKHVDSFFETWDEFGEMDEVINNHVTKFSVDYIFLGLHGTTGNQKLAAKLKTSGALGRLNCPVILVPESFDHKVPRRIVLALDSQSIIEKEIYSPLLSLAKKFNSSFVALYAINGSVTPEDRHQKIALRKILGTKLDSFIFLQSKNAVDSIDGYLYLHSVDLLAVPHRKSSLLKRYFKKNMLDKLVSFTDVPLLTLQR